MNIYELLNKCDDTITGKMDVMLLTEVPALPLKANYKYPVTPTLIAFDDKEREIFSQLQVSQIFVDSDDRILVKVEY